MSTKKVVPAALVMVLGSLVPVVAALGAPESAVPSVPVSAQGGAYSHFLRSRIALSGGDYAAAIGELEKAAVLDPQSSVIHTELAGIHLRLRHHRDAVREADLALATDAKNVEALELAARGYEALGETDKALDAHRRLIDADPGEASHLVQLASLLERAGRQDEAVEVLEKAVTRQPGVSPALFELVEKFRGMGRLDRALDVLEKAAQAEPANVYLQSKLAELYIQLRKPQQAMTALGAMVDLQPDNVDVLMEVGNSLRGLELYPQAAQLFARALELSGGDDGIRLQLAATLATMGDPRSAREEYQKLLASRSRPGASLSNEEHFALLKRIGWLSSELGDLNHAREMLEEARPLAPGDDGDFQRLLARVYDRLGQPGKALAVFEAAAKGHALTDRSWTDMHIGVAASLVVSGDVKGGVAKYGKLVELGVLGARHHGFFAQALLRRPEQAELAERVMRSAVLAAPAEEVQTYVQVANNLLDVGAKDQGFALIEGLLARIPERDLFVYLASRYLRFGSPEREIATLERAALAFPSDVQLHYQLGAAYDRSKRFADSERALETAITLDPKHAAALNYLSYSLADRGVNLEKSLDYALRAVTIDPKNGAFLDTLGWAYFRLGRVDEAKVRLVEALEYVDDPVIRAHFGDVLSRIGDHAAAVEEYEKAVKMGGAREISDLEQKLTTARSLAAAATPPPSPSPTPIP